MVGVKTNHRKCTVNHGFNRSSIWPLEMRPAQNPRSLQGAPRHGRRPNCTFKFLLKPNGLLIVVYELTSPAPTAESPPEAQQFTKLESQAVTVWPACGGSANRTHVAPSALYCGKAGGIGEDTTQRAATCTTNVPEGGSRSFRHLTIGSRASSKKWRKLQEVAEARSSRRKKRKKESLSSLLVRSARVGSGLGRVNAIRPRLHPLSTEK